MLNKVNMLKIVGIGSVCLFLLGCSKESFLLQEEGLMAVSEEVTVSQSSSIKQKEMEEYRTDDEGDETVSRERSEENDIIENETIVEKEIAVHICGAVKQPGVYYLKEKQRLYEGINKAGGFREDADEDYLNQALILEDGMKIVVPTKEETAQLKKTEENVVTSDEVFVQKGDLHSEGTKEKTEEKVNLNIADEKILCTLPGIGASRAKSIIAYREEHGPFKKPEDVMKVSGIKEAAFAKIKDYVTVSD